MFRVIYYRQETVKDLMQRAIDQGGLTLTTENGAPHEIKYQKGYQVSKTGVSFKDTNEALQELTKLIEQRKDSDKWEIGLWYDGEELYIEPSYYYEDFDIANMEGLRYNQKSIHEWHTGENIPVKEVNDMNSEELNDYLTHLIIAKIKGGE